MRRARPRPRVLLLVNIVALVLAMAVAACDTTRQVQGGASDNGGGARIKLGLPF